MKLKLIFLIVSVLIATSCSSTYNASQKSSKNRSNKVIYSIDVDGEYSVIEIEKGKRPEPVQGGDQWVRDFYGAIKYPAKARENSIQGIVILDVEIDEKGKVVSVNIKKGISMECDNEAKRAYVNSTQKGYFPLIIEGKPVNFKMQLPVGFWLA